MTTTGMRKYEGKLHLMTDGISELKRKEIMLIPRFGMQILLAPLWHVLFASIFQSIVIKEQAVFFFNNPWTLNINQFHK